MSIPLDRLYHYIEGIAQEIRNDDVLIYHFYPHGSKKFENLTTLHDYEVVPLMINPEIFCLDQEPLDFDYYQDVKVNWPGKYQSVVDISQIPSRNIKTRLSNIFDKGIILHSERNSPEVTKYRNNNFIPVYYWSHALIALD